MYEIFIERVRPINPCNLVFRRTRLQGLKILGGGFMRFQSKLTAKGGPVFARVLGRGREQASEQYRLTGPRSSHL